MWDQQSLLSAKDRYHLQFERLHFSYDVDNYYLIFVFCSFKNFCMHYLRGIFRFYISIYVFLLSFLLF